LAAFLLFLARMHREWEPVTKTRLLCFGIGLLLLLGLIFRSEKGFVFLLDHANLLFHEAGHPILGLLSERLEPYGGTAGQLVFPVVLAVSCWRKGEAIGVASGGLWFFENFLNIARYMADARTMNLPLVGGGVHDWNTILDRWNLLQYDTRLAEITNVAAWIGFGLITAWILSRAWRDRLRTNQAPIAAAEFQGSPKV
jgi:hypothetical protein